MDTFLNNIFTALFANVQLPHISFAASILRGGTGESLDPHGNKHRPRAGAGTLSTLPVLCSHVLGL